MQRVGNVKRWLAVGGIAPALCGGAMAVGGIAPALCGGAMAVLCGVLCGIGCGDSGDAKQADPNGTLSAGQGGAGSGAGGDGGGGGGVMSAGSGGTTAGTGGPSVAGTGGASAAGSGGESAGSGGMATAGSGGTPAGDWPAADPAGMGPFETVTENNVGPDGAFTLFRPMDLAQSGLPHPVITWGNGTGATPMSYSRLLTKFASHGFIVIASNSENVAQGTPPPMLQGVTWVLEQNDDQSSELYQHVDTMNIGATGHSQGAFATSTAGADERITTTAPIQGARAGTLHGPALLLCGGMDTIVPCSGSQNAFDRISAVPVMYANLLAADHVMWIGSGRGGMPSPYYEVVTAWMRVHLMNDTALRPMFYGADCELCGDSAWEVMQKMMD